jgi:hypothetical protein
MRTIPPKLTYYSTTYTRNGNAQRVSVSLPYIAAIADDPHYAAPPPLPEQEPLAIERPPRWSEKLIRRTLGRDRKRTAKLLAKVGYAAAVRRIEREGW